MKKYCLSLLLLFALMACKTNENAQRSKDDGIMIEKPKGIEDPQVSIDLTTYLKRFPGIRVIGQGGTARISIRGQNSLTASNEPLMLLDGMEFRSYSDLYGAIGTASIKRIEVLKNPDEIGIYGVRGANGVIKITSLKG